MAALALTIRRKDKTRDLVELILQKIVVIARLASQLEICCIYLVPLPLIEIWISGRPVIIVSIQANVRICFSQRKMPEKSLLC